MTKALTGLVIADSVQRGELRLDAPVSNDIPQLRGSLTGAVTMKELVTHTAGFPDFGSATLRRAFINAPVGGSWLTADRGELVAEVRSEHLATRGSYSYSSLGAATAGQAAANAAGMTYADLMRTRLFEPLGMQDTALQTGRALVANGRSPSGLPVQPWVFDAYAPAGRGFPRCTTWPCSPRPSWTAPPRHGRHDPDTAFEPEQHQHRAVVADLHLAVRPDDHLAHR